MISDPTEIKFGDFSIGANWNESVVPGKMFRLRYKDKEQVITREDLYALLFIFGDDDQKDSLIPVVETKVRAITRMLSVKLKKDMRKGEIMKTPYTYYMPESIYEKLIIDKNRYSPGQENSSLEQHVNKSSIITS